MPVDLLANKKGMLALNLIVVVAVFALLFSQLDLGAVGRSLLSVSPLALLAAALAYLALYLVTALRIRFLARGLGASVSLWDCVGAHASSILLSDVTPARIGYSYVAVALRKCGLRTGESARILGVSLASDFILRAVALILLALFVAPAFFGSNLWAAVAILAASTAAALLFVTRNAKFSALLSRVPGAGPRLASTYDVMLSKKFEAGMFALSLVASVLGTLVRGLAWLLLFSSAASVPLAFPNLLVFSALVAVVTGLSFLPVSIAGLGLQEGVGAVAFSQLVGIPLASAAAGMLLCRALELAVDLSGLYWLRGGVGKALEKN